LNLAVFAQKPLPHYETDKAEDSCQKPFPHGEIYDATAPTIPPREAANRHRWHHEAAKDIPLGKEKLMSEDAIEYREEVQVGRRFSSASEGRPHFMGEIVRFRGRNLGWYTAETSIDESRLKRKDVTYSLYQCPGGYRV
jgi:hypothetical protein